MWLFSVFLGSVLALGVVSEAASSWNSFKKFYGRNLSSADDATRQKVFEATRDIVDQHNRLFNRNETSFSMKLNKFSDMSMQEFARYAGQLRGIDLRAEMAALQSALPEASLTARDLPPHVDWRDKGIQSSVRDQGECNACYAIAAAQSLEAAIYLRKTRESPSATLVELSEQHILDCSHTSGNTGCAGGRMSAAFQWIKRNGGVAARSGYPYQGKVGQCNPSTPVEGQLRGFMSMPRKGGEEALKKVVATTGPVAVSIDSLHRSLAQYDHGIWKEPQCSDNVTHAVLLVGYGTEDGEDYWLIKNSWGADWGLQGYFKMSRKFSCGIYTMVTYPYV